MHQAPAPSGIAFREKIRPRQTNPRRGCGGMHGTRPWEARVEFFTFPHFAFALAYDTRPTEWMDLQGRVAMMTRGLGRITVEGG